MFPPLCPADPDSPPPLPKEGLRSVGAPEARALLVHDLATALDVRSRAEFGTGHLEGAICLPLGELERSHGPCQFLDPWRPLILYCQSGARARRAALLLRRQGFRRLLLLGGIASWPYGLIS